MRDCVRNESIRETVGVRLVMDEERHLIWNGHVSRMREYRNAKWLKIERPLGQRPFGWPTYLG